MSAVLQIFALVCSGSTSTLLTQAVANLGAPDRLSMCLIWCKYLAQLMVLAFVKKPTASSAATSRPTNERFYVFAIAALDIVGSVLSLSGTVLLGSGLYQVIFSFQVVSTAFFSRLFLAKEITSTQWLAVGAVVFLCFVASMFVSATVTFGLSISPLSSMLLPTTTNGQALAMTPDTGLCCVHCVLY